MPNPDVDFSWDALSRALRSGCADAVPRNARGHCARPADARPAVRRQWRVALYSHDDMGIGHLRRNLLIAQTLIASSSCASSLIVAGVREATAFAMPAGVDSLSRRAGTFTAEFVGTLKPWHGLSTLAEAFAILHGRDPTYRLLIVGDGPERGRLLGELRVRGEALPGAAQFTGAVSHEAIPGLLASMDVAVAPYPALPDYCFSPLKVCEYLAAVARRILGFTRCEVPLAACHAEGEC
jgi:glycosyltransferase involved in cell wall biosynthesis